MNQKPSTAKFEASAMQTVKRDTTYESLSLEEKALFNYVVFERKSLFFSGEAGSGKSYLLRAIIEKLSALIPEESLAVTAMTGIAAVNIKGETLHSLFESSLEMTAATAEENIRQCLRPALGRKAVREVLERLEVLLIDEVSMLEAKEFDALDLLFKRIKRNNELFGGLEMVLCGDFMELPPVDRENSVTMLFESKEFIKLEEVELTNEFRQADGSLLRVLNKIREGVIDEDVMQTLNSRVEYQSVVDMTERKLLEDAYKEYNEAKSSVENEISNLSNVCAGLSFLEQAKIIRSTFERGSSILNEQFIPPAFPIRLYAFKRQVEEYNKGRLAALERQITTIVASDSGKVDKIDQLDKELELAVGSEVMLRRNLNVEEGMCNGTVGIIAALSYKDMDKHPDKRTLDAYIDDVEILFKSGENHLLVKAVEHEQTENNGRDKVGSRKELPFMLCYAISIHKSQGLTLESAVLSIDRCFENGQAYVALSRIRSLEGMHILGIDYKTIRANPDCIKYHREILKLSHDEPKTFTDTGFFGASYNLIEEETFDSSVFEAFETYREEDLVRDQNQLVLTMPELSSSVSLPQDQTSTEITKTDVPDSVTKVDFEPPINQSESTMRKETEEKGKIRIISGSQPGGLVHEAPSQNVIELSDDESSVCKEEEEPVQKPSKIVIRSIGTKNLFATADKQVELILSSQKPQEEASATEPDSDDEFSLKAQFGKSDETQLTETHFEELYSYEYFLQFLEE